MYVILRRVELIRCDAGNTPSRSRGDDNSGNSASDEFVCVYVCCQRSASPSLIILTVHPVPPTPARFTPHGPASNELRGADGQ